MQIGRSRVRLHELDRLREQVGLVGQRHAHVDVEHVRARGDLRLDVHDHLRQVVLAQLGRERLAPGRVDALADDAERLVVADRDGLRGGRECRVQEGLVR